MMSEDWDDDVTTDTGVSTTAWNGGGFGSTLTNGDAGSGDAGNGSFGPSKWQPSGVTVGRGRGRGSRGASNSDTGSFGSSTGRGSSSFGGFSNAVTNGTSNDSTKFGGWGSSGSVGGNKSGGSGECYKCHETGHFARDCPNAESGGGRGSGECYKCHETGHFARDCPNTESSGGRGGGSGECYKCHETGHFARDCPNAETGGGRGGGSGECYKCHETGHFARDCPNSESTSGRGGGGGGECYKCHETGHFARDCPNESSGGRGGGGGGECYKCHETGHFARECPNADSSGGGVGGCFKCGQSGHRARDCTETPRSGIGGGGDRTCRKCNETGHFARECPNAEQSGESRPPPVTYIPPPPPEDEALIFESMQQGINFNKYDDIPVEVTGREPPRCLQCFEESDLCPQIKINITKAKYEKPTPVQKYGIPIIGYGRDLMACAQTGSGKTAAFLLPIINGMLNNGVTGSSFSEYQEPQCIIVSPTRELAIQIHKEAFKFSHGTMLRPVLAYGGTSKGHQLREIEKGCHLLVATPGRLMDFINSGRVRVGKCKYIVLDEADRMLDMGFGPEMQKLMYLPDMPKKGERQCLMFSATFPNEVQEKAAEYLHDYLFLTVGRVGGATPDITQTILEVGQYDKREKLLEILDSRPEGERVLVFLETKRSADFLATYLSQSQKSATSIHGDREQREREEALRDFRSGVAPILVATSVAARGLDITGVKHVVNYDLPSNIEEYVHRIGRTGRVGNLGQATSFYDPMKDSQLARALIKVLADAQQDVPEFLENAADSAVGTFHGNAGGSFGGRDTRKQFSSRGRGGGSSGGGFSTAQDSWGSGDATNDIGGGSLVGGGFATASFNNADDDDESWD